MNVAVKRVNFFGKHIYIILNTFKFKINALIFIVGFNLNNLNNIIIQT